MASRLRRRYLVSGLGDITLFVELARGIYLQNCGCWGVFVARPLEWYTPWEDVIMLAMTVGIMVTADVRRRYGTRELIV